MRTIETQTIGEAWLAGAVGCPVGTLVVHAKSAHVYEPELALMEGITAK